VFTNASEAQTFYASFNLNTRIDFIRIVTIGGPSMVTCAAGAAPPLEEVCRKSTHLQSVLESISNSLSSFFSCGLSAVHFNLMSVPCRLCYRC